MKQLVLILFCGMLVASCTITKRHFGTGYHVEWNRKMKATIDPEERSKAALTDHSVTPKNSPDPDSLPMDEVELIPEPITDILFAEPKAITTDQAVKQPQLPSGTEIRKDREIKTPELKPRHDLEEEMNRPRLHPLTYAIWGLWGIAIAFCVVLFSGNLYAILVIAGCMFIAMILGIITIATIRKNPEKYRLKAGSYIFSIFSIVLGGIVTLGAILYVLYWIGVID